MKSVFTMIGVAEFENQLNDNAFRCHRLTILDGGVARLRGGGGGDWERLGQIRHSRK